MCLITLFLLLSELVPSCKTLGLAACEVLSSGSNISYFRCLSSLSRRYRSVMVFGNARLVTEEAEKAAALEAFVHSVVPHRNRDVRLVQSPSSCPSARGRGLRERIRNPSKLGLGPGDMSSILQLSHAAPICVSG